MINTNLKENNIASTSNFKLHELKELTFTTMIVFASYILYNSEDKKDSEKEEIYFENILALFEKRLKQKRDELTKDSSPNIFEKNIINNIFNLIDTGLESNFSKFKKEVKSFNDKLISKSKESHETTVSKPRDNINLRKFLYNNIHTLKLPTEVKKKFKPLKKLRSLKDNFSQKLSIEKRNMQNLKKGEKGNKGLINSDEDQDEQVEDKESLEKIENIRLINQYKEQLNAERDVENDPILEDYIDNFSEIRKKYFKHLRLFQVDIYNFSDDKEKDEIERNKIINFNNLSKIKEKQLTELYKQKYIIKENQLIYFLKNLGVWECNIRPLFHKKLRKEYNEKKEAEVLNLKNNEKKDGESLENENLNYINPLEVNLRDISASIRNNILAQEKEKIAHIVNSDLPFNYELFLIPGEAKNKSDEKKPDNPLTKYISKQDFIYKSIIGDFYWTLFNKGSLDEDCHSFLDTPIQLYLKEAKHFFNLKVFQCKIKPQNQNPSELDELRIGENYYYIYGSIHIESEYNIIIKLDNETISLNIDDKAEKNIFIDIINIYNENEGKKINETEKYLVNPNANAFQVFISCDQDNPNAFVNTKETKEGYLRKFVVPVMNFDLRSLNYEAKKIIIKPADEENDYFKLTPTFLNVNYTNVNYFEINYENKNKLKINDDDIQNADLGVYSFDIKIKTFIDLNKKDD